MKYLADENIPLRTVEILQKEGFDIASVRDILPGANDEEVLKISIREDRILLTFDKDFGEMVFKGKAFSPRGIILLRLEPKSEVYVTEELKKLFTREIDFERHFTIVGKDKIRVVPL